MKVRLSENEAYPVYSITDRDHETEVDVLEETVERWKAAIAEFAVVQKEMAAALEVVYAKRREA